MPGKVNLSPINGIYRLRDFPIHKKVYSLKAENHWPIHRYLDCGSPLLRGRAGMRNQEGMEDGLVIFDNKVWLFGTDRSTVDLQNSPTRQPNYFTPGLWVGEKNLRLGMNLWETASCMLWGRKKLEGLDFHCHDILTPQHIPREGPLAF